jgi:hypothetical protein
LSPSVMVTMMMMGQEDRPSIVDALAVALPLVATWCLRLKGTVLEYEEALTRLVLLSYPPRLSRSLFGFSVLLLTADDGDGVDAHLISLVMEMVSWILALLVVSSVMAVISKKSNDVAVEWKGAVLIGESQNGRTCVW